MSNRIYARHNPHWLLKLAGWIGKLRANYQRRQELKAQNFSDKAIKGLLEVVLKRKE